MKGVIKSCIGWLGLKITRIDTPMRSFEAGLKKLSAYIAPTDVIDIGVDYGSPELYKRFPASKHKYLLVEADPANITTLKKIAAQLHARYENVFCGSQTGTAVLYTSENHAYSSAYAPSRNYKPVDVPVRTLDSMTTTERDSNASFLLKIDVEGAELDVLRGATETLSQTTAVILEASIARKFEGGAEFGDIVSFLRECGFSVFDICSGFDRDGKLYQVDALFVRTDAPFR